MDAFTKGRRQGQDYLARFRIQSISFDGYRAMGRAVSKKRYTRPNAQESYQNGWQSIGEQFQSLFKLDDQNTSVARAKINAVRTGLERDRIDLEQLLGWRSDDPTTQKYLRAAYRAVEEAQDQIDDLLGDL